MQRAHCRLATAPALGHGEANETVCKDEYGMNRIMAAAAFSAALSAGLGLAGCGQNGAPDRAAANTAAPGVATASTTVAAAETAAPVVAAAVPATSGAPAFALLYPGATVTSPATVAQGPEGAGAMVSFTTPASPEDVIAFYRQHAESAGLMSVNSMNRGTARAYGAAAGDGSGSLLHVVADAPGDGQTHVQLDWTEAK